LRKLIIFHPDHKSQAGRIYQTRHIAAFASPYKFTTKTPAPSIPAKTSPLHEYRLKHPVQVSLSFAGLDWGHR
jgi:hypothetical protein